MRASCASLRSPPGAARFMRRAMRRKWATFMRLRPVALLPGPIVASFNLVSETLPAMLLAAAGKFSVAFRTFHTPPPSVVLDRAETVPVRLRVPLLTWTEPPALLLTVALMLDVPLPADLRNVPPDGRLIRPEPLMPLSLWMSYRAPDWMLRVPPLKPKLLAVWVIVPASVRVPPSVWDEAPLMVAVAPADRVNEAPLSVPLVQVNEPPEETAIPAVPRALALWKCPAIRRPRTLSRRYTASRSAAGL